MELKILETTVPIATPSTDICKTTTKNKFKIMLMTPPINNAISGL